MLTAGCSQKPPGSLLVEALPSSVDPVLLFGLGELDLIDPEVVWPDKSRQMQENVTVNRNIILNQNEASDEGLEMQNPENIFLVLDESSMGLNITHEGGLYRDRLITPLMPYTLSNLAPALTYGDINSDGLEDIFIGGGFDQPASFFLPNTDGFFDLLLVGNNFGSQPETGYVAALGVMLNGTGIFSFSQVFPGITGMYASGDVRKFELDPTRTVPLFLLGRHNNTLMPYLYNYQIE